MRQSLTCEEPYWALSLCMLPSMFPVSPVIAAESGTTACPGCLLVSQLSVDACNSIHQLPGMQKCDVTLITLMVLKM